MQMTTKFVEYIFMSQRLNYRISVSVRDMLLVAEDILLPKVIAEFLIKLLMFEMYLNFSRTDIRQKPNNYTFL